MSDDFGLTEFCALVKSHEGGFKTCTNTWKAELEGIYVCPVGLCDFSVPIVLPNGSVLGRVMAGQALAEGQDEEEILDHVESLGIDREAARERLAQMSRKTKREMDGAYRLLKEMLAFFVDKSYQTWKTAAALREAPARQDRTLSQITQIMYSYNLTVDVETGTYSLITGTGMPRTVEEYKRHSRNEELRAFQNAAIHPSYLARFHRLTCFDQEHCAQLADGYRGSLEYPVRYPGTDETEWHEINVFIGTEEDGRRVANVLGRDITQAHNEADTRDQLEIAKASSAAKTAFLFNMSHDIRTPMNAIIGFTELLSKHLDDPELARSYIGKIQASNEFLLSLINNVLEMARIESGKETLDEAYWDAYEFNDSLFALFDSQMREKGIEFICNATVEHDKIICDETKLREIFLNMLSNALKYTPAGGTVTMTLSELPSAVPGYAVYQTVIEDTGIGMSEDFLPHIFEEFTRERSSTESRVAGTGLGMPIVKKLVDLMKGTVEVESQVGKGTRFTVTLPHRIAAVEDAAREERESATSHAADFAGKRILLAEDNDLNAEIACAILEEFGIAVERAEDGVVCVDMLRKAQPGWYDLVLMDIQMPNMDGYRAAQTIRKQPDAAKAAIPIIAMTANAFEEDKRNAFRAGMNDHVAKPFRVEELMGAIERALNA